MEIQRIIRYVLSIALTVVFLLHVGGKLEIPVLTSMENLAYDARLKLTLPNVEDKKVVIVDIDEKSLKEIGRWPWNRDVMSRIVDTLFDDYHITEIGFDIVFAEADIDQAATLLDTMATGPLRNDKHPFWSSMKKSSPLSSATKCLRNHWKIARPSWAWYLKTMIKRNYSGKLPEPVWHLDRSMKDQIPFEKPTGYTANLAMLQDAAYSGGFFDNPLLDDDGIFRRVPLLQVYDGQLHESLALALTRAAMGSPRVELVVETNGDNNQEMFLEWVKIGETLIPVDEQAGVLVPYLGRQKSFDYISAVDVLNKTVDPKRLQNKIAIFGTSAPGLLDLRTTPLEPAYPGVEIHANIIQGILDQRILHQPGYTVGFEFITLAVIGLLLTFVLPILSPIWSTLAVSGLISLVIGSNLYFWTEQQLVLPVATPVILIALLFTLQMTYGFFVESRGKRQLAHLFGQYVPPELVNEMSLKMDEINLDGEIREMSVLFTDVRGFTTISEGMAPKELTQYINGFLTPITRVIHDERGTIDKYMGDAVMAFWGAPLADQQHALHALTAAIKIVECMKILREEFARKNWPPIYIGIGINSGEMNVGNKGSEFRVDYTVLGDAVNLGSRLEGLTRQYAVDVITSELHASRSTRVRIPRTRPGTRQGQGQAGYHLRAPRTAGERRKIGSPGPETLSPRPQALPCSALG